jgi:hypothetical protein
MNLSLWLVLPEEVDEVDGARVSWELRVYWSWMDG